MDLLKTETKPDILSDSCQNEDINKLNMKLEKYNEGVVETDEVKALREEIELWKKKYNEVVVERDEVKALREEIELWKERFENGYKRIINEQKTTCEVQLDMLKKATDAEHESNIKLRELQNINNCISNEMKNLRLDENNLQSKLADNDKIIQKCMKDLCIAKSELEEKKREAELLKMNLNSSKDKLCNVVRELECCIKERDQLDEDFKCIKIKLAEVNKCAIRTEKNLTLELETLSNELKNNSNILNELHIQHDQAKCELNSEKCKVKQLTENLAKANEEKEYDQIELKNELEMLKKENCLKENDIHNLKKKVEKCHRKNKCQVIEINRQKMELEEMKCQLNLKSMTLSLERIEIENQTQNCCNNLKTESITSEYTPNTNTTNFIDLKTELNNLTCELDKIKGDLGIDFLTKKL